MNENIEAQAERLINKIFTIIKTKAVIQNPTVWEKYAMKEVKELLVNTQNTAK